MIFETRWTIKQKLPDVKQIILANNNNNNKISIVPYGYNFRDKL